MKQVHIEEISLTGGSGPRVVLIPAGSMFHEAEDTSSGTIRIKRGSASTVDMDPKGSFRAEPLDAMLCYPQTYVEFSSGNGIASYVATENRGPIKAFADGTDLETVLA